MPEMKNSFQRGKMNKDLDERLVPNGEYRDALNVQVSTSDTSDVGSLQTVMGNTALTSVFPSDSVCVGSITDEKNDKIYWLVAGETTDVIAEYDYVSETVEPVCVDRHAFYGRRTLNFRRENLVTGLNVMDGFIFWTDNFSEPKKVNIQRCKLGSAGFNNHTLFMVKDVSIGAIPNNFTPALDINGVSIPIQEKHLTIIKKGPDAAPVLEMRDTTVGDWDGDGIVGGSELSAPVTNASSITFLDSDGEFVPNITINTASGTDFPPDSFLNIYKSNDRSIKVRVKINGPGGPVGYNVDILSGNKDIAGETDLIVELEQEEALFEFKFPRFAYRYKYEDGEYSPYSPFTQPAFLPGRFIYLPKEGYNLGMVNRLRRLAIKDFVHTRSMPEDVVAIDVLYKESNSPNVYSVKTIKRRGYNPDKWDEYNAVSEDLVVENGIQIGDGWAGRTKGFLPITTEMIHAVLPSNQLLRPWDNVPRKALAQEIVGNRLVYGNYLQNYNLSNNATGDSNIKVDLKVKIRSRSLGSISPEEVEAGPNRRSIKYSPSKSLKTLRTYQVGVVYIDKYGRETPVFSEDKRGRTATGAATSQASVYNKKENANKKNSLTVELKNDPPDWATHFKLFVKETSNEYYNLAMDRWYDAEDGNIWLSFPSAERNKVDEETFLILKKAHDANTFISAPARYKIIAISNEAPRFIKLSNISQGGIVDNGSALGLSASGFPLEGGFFVYVEQTAFENVGWKESLINQDISQTFMRVKSASGISEYYRLKQITFDASTGNYYKLEADRVFGPDMAHTSPDGTFLNRITNCELQLIKRIPEDKAEFEGRFFVKVLKDNILIESLNITPNSGLDYIAVASMQVQYINPLAAQATGGWDGFGTNKYKISMDKRNDDRWTRPGSSAPAGHGQDFWKYASDDTTTNNSNALAISSGWFIDAVEGFRPWKGDYWGKNVGERSTAAIDRPSAWAVNFCWGFFSSYHNDFDDGEFDRRLHALGVNTYGTTGNNYLGSSGSKKMKSPNGVLATTPSADGGPIAPGVGIDPNSGIINLSYSGLNEDDGGLTATSGNWADVLTTHYFVDAAKHAADELFIGKLLTPGTIWRWKEDPDQVLYKTVAMTGLSTTSTPYTSAQWTNEGLDFDGNPGIVLFNYVSFADYLINNHVHRVEYCWGSGDNEDDKPDWVTRNIGNHTAPSGWCCGGCAVCGAGAGWTLVNTSCSITAGTNCGCNHNGTSGSNAWGAIPNYPEHYKFPNLVDDWAKSKNKRRRFRFKAETLSDPTIPLGGTGHNYLPTNNPTFAPHFDHTATAITIDPSTNAAFVDPAPGIRPDGMHTGYTEPTGNWTWNPGTGSTTETLIPQYKRWSSDNIAITPAPGSVTWEIVEPFTPGEGKFSSTNPAIWETEPKEDVGLDIYYEVGHKYPIYLNDRTIEQFVGAVHEDISKNSYVQCWDPAPPIGNSSGTISLNAGGNSDMRVYATHGRFVQLADTLGNVLDANNPAHTLPTTGAYLIFYRADGSTTEAHVGVGTYNNNGTWFELVGNSFNDDVGVHSKMIEIPWFNCYSFGNGVESDRIRDDFNQVTIDNGPKASTTLEEPYLEDRRKSGFIWSGIYNSKSGVNNLNQFIQAEAITKDANPVYGSIQKMHVRDNDLVAFCEDRVLKVLANKDALFNADGNTNLVSTNRVLGNIRPFVGDFGISQNPESFASDSYRSYFADTSRGAIVRLSQDGLTAISNLGMKDWFADNLPSYNRIIGSFDDNKNEYNITLTKVNKSGYITPSYGYMPKTLSFNEPANGWVSFKSFIKESGLSLNNSYYTYFEGNLYIHHDNEIRNNFYNVQYESSVDVLFNQAPGVIKSFKTLNYEGTQSRVTPDLNNNPDYYDNYLKQGWYVNEMISDVQELGVMEFWDKEDKWFSQIKGVATEWLNDGTAGNIDPREFSFQGIGNAFDVECADCPDVVSYDCINQPAGSVSDCDNRVLTPASTAYPGNFQSHTWWFENYTEKRSDYKFIVNSSVNGPPAYQTWVDNQNPGNNPDYVNSNDPSQGWYNKYEPLELYELEFGSTSTLDRLIYQGDTVEDIINYVRDVIIDPNDTATRNLFYVGMSWNDFRNRYNLLYSGGQIPSARTVNKNSPCQRVFSPGGVRCTEIQGPGGAYATMQQCIEGGCGQPEESYNCDTEAGCVDPGDGTGQFSTYCECVESRCCPESQAYFFECQNINPPSNTAIVFGCMDDGITTDPWITHDRPANWVGPASNYYAGAQADDCSCIYQTVSTWDCINSSCVEVFNGTGQYPSLAVCQQNCAPPCTGPFVPTPPALTHIISNRPGGCNLGDYFNTGAAELGITNNSINPTNWFVQVFDSNNNLIHTSANVSGVTSIIVNNLAPGIYTYKIIDIDTNCDYDYTFEILCEDPPPPPPVTYDCVLVNGIHTCVDPGTGNGQYTGSSALTDCQTDPNSPCNPNYQTGGCTDPCACNWDPNASYDDGSCIYDCDTGGLTLFDASVGYQNQLNAGVYTPTEVTIITNALNGLISVSTGTGGPTTCYDCGGPGVNLPNEPYFVNNESMMESFVRTYGIDTDTRDYKFYRSQTYLNPSIRTYMNLRISHIDLNGWYQQPMNFFTWRDYIDTAIATGVIASPTSLIDPNCTTSTCQTAPHQFDPSTGYRIDLNAVRYVIHTNMEAAGVETCNGIVSTYNQGGHGDIDDKNCDRTNVTLCDPCIVPATNPCGPPPPQVTYPCIPGDPNSCMPGYTPLGPNVYTSLGDCLTACNIIGEIPLSYDCVNGSCIDPGTGLGQYNTLAACQAVCNISPIDQNYACEGPAGSQNCVPTSSPVGTYGSTVVYGDQATCLANCGTVSSTDIAWGGCCHPSSMEYSQLGPNGLPCHADSLCLCYYDPFHCTLPNCFVGDTRVLLADGSSKNIENVVIGDIVSSYDQENKELSDAVVIATRSQVSKNMVEFTFSNGVTTKNTSDHPYYVEQKGWVSYADDLKVGDVCYTNENNNINKVTLTNIKEVDGDSKTYIFTLDRHKTFFANSVLVHNKG